MSGILQTLFLGAAGAVKDAYFNLVTLLLNTTATNGAQNNTFLDSSTNNYTITRNGNTTQGTFTPFSQTGWSAYNSGSSSYCQLNNSDYSISTGDFTIEFWMFVTSDKAATCFCSATSNPNLTVAMNSGSTGARLPYLEYAGATTFATAFSNYLNTWTHVAFVRSSGTVTVYQNGVAITSASKSGAVGTTANLYLMRNSGDAGQDFPGYISNFRICKAAVYTGNFTPTTTNFTTTSQGATSCQLLTFQNNRFVDNSTNASTVTPTLTQVQAFSPFAPAAAYDSAVVGGSGYFDGTGDYLTVGSGTDVDLGTSDFMIEAWYYCLANGTYVSGVISKRVGGAASGWGMTTSGFVCDMAGTWYDSWSNPFWVGSTQNSGFNSGTSLQKLNQWTHIVITRQGTDARWFVNGQLLGYFSRTGAIQQLTGSPLAVGLNGTTAEQPFIGFLSNCRVVVGSVPTGYQTSSTTLNTQIFTPPTAPVSTTSQGATSTNVKYIGNFINAGIYDSAAKNDLETVGDAQVSTTQAKWGTTSMYFDGTGDYLQLANPSPNLQLGSGNFTIEMWVNFSVVSATRVLNNYGYDAGGNKSFIIYYDASTLHFGYSPDGTSSTDVSLGAFVPVVGTWYHIAIVRNSTTVTGYVSGTALSSPLTIGTNSIYFPANNANFRIGTDASNYFNGYIDDFRITKGYARYTANFTPPAAAFPLQ
ncbi:MAG: Synechococcus phage [Actinomycetota bacterium]|jgi:hypothetical protein